VENKTPPLTFHASCFTVPLVKTNLPLACTQNANLVTRSVLRFKITPVLVSASKYMTSSMVLQHNIPVQAVLQTCAHYATALLQWVTLRSICSIQVRECQNTHKQTENSCRTPSQCKHLQIFAKACRRQISVEGQKEVMTSNVQQDSLIH
jgi:hypothetical protein